MVQTTQLGAAGPTVSAFGLGCMGMSGVYGTADRGEAIATIHAALGAGITLLDTGDFYGMGHNELLIAEALASRNRDEALISVKFGAQRGPDGAWLGYDASPAAVKTACAYSLQRLRTDHIDIYRPARLDASVPIEETVGAIAELSRPGTCATSASPRSARRRSVGPPPCTRSATFRSSTRCSRAGSSAAILPACRELGIAITAYGVLSRGLISGHYRADAEPQVGDMRGRMPRFQGENLAPQPGPGRRAARGRDAKGATVAQIAFAWVRSRGEDIVPLVGARRRDQLQEALGALELELSPQDLERIERAIPSDAAAGDRYGAPQMADLDSER